MFGASKISNEIRDYMYAFLSKLSSQERREIVVYLQDMELSAATLKDTGDLVKEKRFNSGFFYPHCRSKYVVRHGFCGDRQRYSCKTCTKTFTDLTGTPLHRLQHKEKFFQSLRCMLEGTPYPEQQKR